MIKEYSLDFKLKAVAMSNERGSRAAVAMQLNISMQTLKNWRYDCLKSGLIEKVSRAKSKQDFIIIHLRKQLRKIKNSSNC